MGTGTVIYLLMIVEWAKDTAVVIGFIAIVVLSILVIVSKAKEDAHKSDKDRADALEKLLKSKEAEIAELTTLLQEQEDEIESMSVEYRTLAGITIKTLFEYWEVREQELAMYENRRTEINRLTNRLKLYENPKE